MSVREHLDILDRVAKIAELAGIKGEIDEQRMTFVSIFQIDETRSQVVQIKNVGKAVNGEEIVMIFSPCLSAKKGMLSGISKDQALDLLKRNEGQFFGRFGMVSFDDKDLVVVSSDHIVSTLDPGELELHMYYIANIADAYEAKHSKTDDF